MLDEAMAISTPDDWVTVAQVPIGRAFVALGRGDHDRACALGARGGRARRRARVPDDAAGDAARLRRAPGRRRPARTRRARRSRGRARSRDRKGSTRPRRSGGRAPRELDLGRRGRPYTEPCRKFSTFRTRSPPSWRGWGRRARRAARPPRLHDPAARQPADARRRRREGRRGARGDRRARRAGRGRPPDRRADRRRGARRARGRTTTSARCSTTSSGATAASRSRRRP